MGNIGNNSVNVLTRSRGRINCSKADNVAALTEIIVFVNRGINTLPPLISSSM